MLVQLQNGVICQGDSTPQYLLFLPNADDFKNHVIEFRDELFGIDSLLIIHLLVIGFELF